MKKGNKIAKLFSFLLLILSFTFLYLLIRVNILPSKYFIKIGIGILIANLILFILMKFTKSKIIKLFSLVCCIGLGYGIFSLFNTSNILTSMNINYKTNNYVLLVNKNSIYDKLKDLNNKKIGYLSEDKKVLKKIRINYDSINYNDSDKMINALFDEYIDGIILEQSYLEMLSEENNSIKENTKVIYKFKLNTKVTNITNDVDTSNNPFILYISGIDTYGSISSVSRTDANILLVVNPKTYQILMISIPRDYYIDLYGKNAKDKLTHSGIYGIDTTIKSIEKLLDIEINYYYKVNFTSIIDIVDTIDGVDVESKYAFTSKDGYKYTKGINHLNGKEALSFVRERKAFNGGDRTRNMNQQAMITALFNKCTSSNVITKYNELLNSIKNSFVTNMPQNRLTKLIKNQMDKNPKWTITNYYLDGTNSREYTYSYKSNKLYVMLPNQDTIDEAKEMINTIKSGKTINHDNEKKES